MIEKVYKVVFKCKDYFPAFDIKINRHLCINKFKEKFKGNVIAKLFT